VSLQSIGIAADSRSVPGRSFKAPGRVNLIGEHVDYTGGVVLPIAIPFATIVELRRHPAISGYTFTSESSYEEEHIGIADRSPGRGAWCDYPIGVLRELQKLNLELPPFELHVCSDVPQNVGLSSSASLEVATAMALLFHCGAALSAKEIAMLCQRAENNYVGSPCGIMDQFAVTAAMRGHALLLNTRTLDFQQLPLCQGGLAETVIIVANSGVRHSISAGDYGVRRRELEAGQTALRERFPRLRDLSEATLDQLQTCERMMSPMSFRRCRHVITENARVYEAREAMLAGDPIRLGAAMIASHQSQCDDFECSVEEIDFLVATARRSPACFGARLTGGGFGGCTVNLIQAGSEDRFCSELAEAFNFRFGHRPETYICAASDGALAYTELSQEELS